jgi:hypothetical protein
MWQAGPQDIMVSFDVMSLFTRVPVREAMSLLGRHFAELFRHVLTASYFSFAGQFYEQTDGVAMGFHTASGYHQLHHGRLYDSVRPRNFPDHVISVHHETERDCHLPILDIDIYRRPDTSAIKNTVNLPTPTST